MIFEMVEAGKDELVWANSVVKECGASAGKPGFGSMMWVKDSKGGWERVSEGCLLVLEELTEEAV